MIKRSPAEHWEHVEPMLGALLAAPTDERAALLDELSAGDQTLRSELRSLLDAHGRAGDFLDTSAAAFAASHMMDTLESVETQSPGVMVGRYRLLEEIGRGGMGAVWLAERADGQFDQRVALKLVKRGMDTDEILARFIRERQILARLEHPNIARLLDGGVSEDGRPYFAMEERNRLNRAGGCSAERYVGEGDAWRCWGGVDDVVDSVVVAVSRTPPGGQGTVFVRRSIADIDWQSAVGIHYEQFDWVLPGDESFERNLSPIR